MAFVNGGRAVALLCALAVGFVALNTAAELWISAGSWGVALGMAPEGSSRHFTFYTSAESVGSAVGAGVTAVVLDSLGADGWWLFAGIALIAVALTLTLTRTREPSVPENVRVPVGPPTTGVAQ